MKKLISVLLVVVLMVGMSVNAFARWSTISSIAGDLDIASSGKASVVGQVTSFSADELKIGISLQRNGSEIKTWSASNVGQIVEATGTYYVTKGYSYKIVITARAYIGGSLMETATKTIDYGYFG
ncbi:hypothetical protein [Hydrogenoanaerobacterium sp.]|uniref:hypothetical protein n=1 Tax=Hydrogenoanaerobacterium sp. TaxID=2953763 RepID=UPI0028A14398|nr:hypothetical protein [Hydrogenoanaerobacterium sp.]